MNLKQSEKRSLDAYRCLCETVNDFQLQLNQPLNDNPERLIGYDYLADFFSSLVPLADFDDNEVLQKLEDFPELFPEAFPNRQATGKAVIFTGEAGCGKHTADYTFMSLVYQFIEETYSEEMLENGIYSTPKPSDLDEIVEFYCIDFPFYEFYSERELSDKLDELFELIYEKTLSNPSVFYYFSIGDVTRVLNNPKLAMRFADKVRRLIDKPQSFCILTCIYCGKASEVKDEYKMPFYVLEMTPPDREAREEYFSYLLSRYPNINFGTDSKTIAELTNGFTFADVKKLTGYLFTNIKSQLRKNMLKVKDIRFNMLDQRELISLNEDIVKKYINMIKNARYIQQEPIAAPTIPYPVMSGAANAQMIAAPVQTDNTQLSTEDSENDKEASEKLIAERATKAKESVNTVSGLRKALNNAVVPANYHLKKLLSNRIFDTNVFRTYISSLDAFLRWCSDKGLENLSNIHSIVISLGGEPDLRPVDKQKLHPLSDGSTYDYHAIIREGNIVSENLHRIDKDTNWLETQLKKNQCKSVTEVFLGVCDENNELIVFKMAVKD